MNDSAGFIRSKGILYGFDATARAPQRPTTFVLFILLEHAIDHASLVLTSGARGFPGARLATCRTLQIVRQNRHSGVSVFRLKTEIGVAGEPLLVLRKCEIHLRFAKFSRLQGR